MNWLVGWSVDGTFDWFIDWVVDWWVYWLMGLLIDGSVDWWVYWLIGSLVDRLIGRRSSWLCVLVWLVDWLIHTALDSWLRRVVEYKSSTTCYKLNAAIYLADIRQLKLTIIYDNKSTKFSNNDKFSNRIWILEYNTYKSRVVNKYQGNIKLGCPPENQANKHNKIRINCDHFSNICTVH
jgi:hypothetical protein